MYFSTCLAWLIITSGVLLFLLLAFDAWVLRFFVGILFVWSGLPHEKDPMP